MKTRLIARYKWGKWGWEDAKMSNGRMGKTGKWGQEEWGKWAQDEWEKRKEDGRN